MHAVLITRCAQLAEGAPCKVALLLSFSLVCCSSVVFLRIRRPPLLCFIQTFCHPLSLIAIPTRARCIVRASATLFTGGWNGQTEKVQKSTTAAPSCSSANRVFFFSPFPFSFLHNTRKIRAVPAPLVQMRLLSSLKQQMAGSSSQGHSKQQSERRRNFPSIRVVTNSPPKATKVQTIRHDDDYLETRVAMGPVGTALEESLEAHREAGVYARTITSPKYEATAPSPLSPRPSTRKCAVNRRRAGTIGSIDSGSYLPSPTSTAANSISSAVGLLNTADMPDTVYQQLHSHPLTPISPNPQHLQSFPLAQLPPACVVLAR
ncbi:hypothetical protein DL89DRAFT_157353 [Linderina pennispora]|uniref:Uncharacterized protein n=1 Tax=Linderina pennispora TaxID=61395 RepID=A0A1Y1VUB8_9FUNG|nr:uncharacterized protein DL89DRAFT_157353 [Linderina pennispora]ORX64783.1 hypothetical protein DL89DRAFT_157353 [Linderina pennispora]